MHRAFKKRIFLRKFDPVIRNPEDRVIFLGTNLSRSSNRLRKTKFAEPASPLSQRTEPRFVNAETARNARDR